MEHKQCSGIRISYLEQLTHIYRLTKVAQENLINGQLEKAEHQAELLKSLKEKLSPAKTLLSSSSKIRPVRKTIAPAKKITFLDVFAKYKDERKSVTSNSSLIATEKKLLVINELLNEKSLDKITRDEAIKIRDLLILLPANINKFKEFKDLSLLQAIKKNKTVGKPTLSNGTVSDYIQKGSTIMKYAITHNLLSYNPFESIPIEKKNTKKIDDRDPFSTSELNIIFSTDIFQKLIFKKEYMFWLPLLGIYTGARLNELCQLHKEDIIEIDNIWCIDITNDGSRRTKNIASIRLVPLHSNLIRLGFIDYVKQRKKGLIFDGLTYKEKSGYGDNASKWFGRFKTSLGFAKRLKCFHSFRHTVLDFYKQKTNVETRFSQAIVGHEQGEVTYDTYGSEFKPGILIEYVELLPWDKVIPALKTINPRVF